VLDIYPACSGKRGYGHMDRHDDRAGVRSQRKVVGTEGYQSIERRGRTRCLPNLRNTPKRHRRGEPRFHLCAPSRVVESALLLASRSRHGPTPFRATHSFGCTNRGVNTTAPARFLYDVRCATQAAETTRKRYDRSVQPDVISWYDLNAAWLAAAYETVPALPTQEWLHDLLPKEPALVVDVGSGSGRDASAFAAAGHGVIAVEPSSGMRAEAIRLNSSARIRWVADSLPALATTTRIGLVADLVSMNAVWQHVAPADRPRAFRKLVGLLRSGGLLAMTLRHGPDDGRGAYPVGLAEVEALARDHGLQVVRTVVVADLMGRLDVS